MAEHICKSSGAIKRIAERNCIGCLRDAVCYAIQQTYFGGHRGGLSESECQTVHDKLIKKIPNVHQ